MKKLDNFVSCLAVLQKANFDLAGKDEIYRTGVLGQFNLVFELAWKTLQEVLRCMVQRFLVHLVRCCRRGINMALLMMNRYGY